MSDHEKDAQVLKLLGAICDEAGQLITELMGKEHKVVILALDGERVQYCSRLPFGTVKAACEIVTAQITKIGNSKEPPKLLLPESVRKAMN